MTNYRRFYLPNATYFFTVVTDHRRNLFDDAYARACLRESFSFVQNRWPFEVEAIVLLPDHLHAIWRLPEGDSNFSTRWRLIKYKFSLKYIGCKREESLSLSRRKKGERLVWQRRFWEHLIRDEKDFENHLNYIHYNPVKHQYVRKPSEWKWSTFHEFVRLGWYSSEWGNSESDTPNIQCVV